MFAVIETGGKQYKVKKGCVLSCEKLDVPVGNDIQFQNVLLIDDGSGQVTVGAPYVPDVTVSASVLEQKRGEKLVIFKKRRRKNYRRKTGHRQSISVLRIVDIVVSPEQSEKSEN